VVTGGDADLVLVLLLIVKILASLHSCFGEFFRRDARVVNRVEILAREKGDGSQGEVAVPLLHLLCTCFPS